MMKLFGRWGIWVAREEIDLVLEEILPSSPPTRKSRRDESRSKTRHCKVEGKVR